MIERYIREFILKWVLAYVAKAGLGVDWEKMKAKAVAYLSVLADFVEDFQRKVAPAIPDFIEAPLFKLMNEVVSTLRVSLTEIVDDVCEVLKDALSDAQNQKELIQAILAQDWERAFKELKEVLEQKQHPASRKVLASMGFESAVA